MSRVHFDLGPCEEMRDFGARLVPCSRRFLAADLVSADRAEVTCKACTKKLASIGASERESVFESSGEYTVRRQQWEHPGPAIVQRSRGGDDGSERVGWATLDDALRDWWETIGASLIGSSSSFGGAGGGRSDSMPGIIAKRTRVLRVGRAIERACADGHRFSGDENGVGALFVHERACFQLIASYMTNASAAQISGNLSLDARIEITTRQVGLVWAALRRSIRAYLVEHRLLARDAKGRQNPRKVSEVDMAHLPGHDIQGIKEIADHLGVSQATVFRLLNRGANENALPVTRYLGGVYASRAILDAWRVREARTSAA